MHSVRLKNQGHLVSGVISRRMKLYPVADKKIVLVYDATVSMAVLFVFVNIVGYISCARFSTQQSNNCSDNFDLEIIFVLYSDLSLPGCCESLYYYSYSPVQDCECLCCKKTLKTLQTCLFKIGHIGRLLAVPADKGLRPLTAELASHRRAF